MHFVTCACSYFAQGERVKTQQVDLSLQSAYGITGATPKNMYEAACQYYEVDWVREFFLSKPSAYLISNSSGMHVFLT
jgi:hypothetical protein